MRNDYKASIRHWKKALLMPLLAAVAVLYFSACSEIPESVDSRATAFTDTASAVPPESENSEAQITTSETVPTESCEKPIETTRPTEPPDEVSDIHTQTSESLVAIPYGTVYEYSDRYYEDESFVRVAGIDGCKLITVVTTFEGDKATGVSEKEEVLYLPTCEIIVVGTKDVITYDTLIVTEDETGFETKYEYDENAYDDERTTVQEGKGGYTTSEYRVTYEKGVEIARELVASEVTPSVPEIIRIGTKPAHAEEQITSKENLISYKTVYEYDSTLEDGVRKTKTAGENGYTENTYLITYYHGEEVSRELVKSTVHEPQNEVIVIGTKKEETFGMPYIDAAHGGYDYNVTQDFGGSNSHGGIDFGVWYGEALVAVMSGTVVYAYDEGDIPTSDLRWTYGTYVVVEHDNGTRSYYAHMSSRTVSVGDTVKKGEIVGYSGNTGRVSPSPTASNPLAGTHLHFEIRVWNGNTYIKADPKDYLPRWNY